MRIDSSLEQVLFGTRAILVRKLFRKKAFSEEVLFGKSLFFEKAIFRIACFSWIATLLEWLHFWKSFLSIAANFSKELHFHNIMFQKRYYLAAALPFHSSTSYLSVSKQVTSIVWYSKNLRVLSWVSITTRSLVIGKVYFNSRLHRVLWNSYFFSKLLL